jgi:hypothetical protein
VNTKLRNTHRRDTCTTPLQMVVNLIRIQTGSFTCQTEALSLHAAPTKLSMNSARNILRKRHSGILIDLRKSGCVGLGQPDGGGLRGRTMYATTPEEITKRRGAVAPLGLSRWTAKDVRSPGGASPGLMQASGRRSGTNREFF